MKFMSYNIHSYTIFLPLDMYITFTLYGTLVYWSDCSRTQLVRALGYDAYEKNVCKYWVKRQCLPISIILTRVHQPHCVLRVPDWGTRIKLLLEPEAKTPELSFTNERDTVTTPQHHLLNGQHESADLLAFWQQALARVHGDAHPKLINGEL